MKTLLYIFTRGRKARLEALSEAEDCPQEFLFGLPYLQDRGYQVDMLEMDELPYDESHPFYQTLYHENFALNQRLPWECRSHQLAGYVEQMNRYDLIVAGNETVAFAVADLIRRKLVDTPMMFFVMGALAKLPKIRSIAVFQQLFRENRSIHLRDLSNCILKYNTVYRFAKDYYQQLLQHSHSAIFIGQGEYHYALKKFRRFQEKLSFLPFAVDTEFWTPLENSQSGKSGPYVLFMGKDQNRDFRLVTKIAKQLSEVQFKFVTRNIPEYRIRSNVELIAGEWKEMILTDQEVRNIVQRCSLVILPLKSTIQPSGQSVALQAMACAKPVLITKTDGFWEPGTFIHGQHVHFIHSDSLGEWCEAIMRFLQNYTLAKRLGQNARKLVETNNTLELFGQRLEHILLDHFKKTS